MVDTQENVSAPLLNLAYTPKIILAIADYHVIAMV